MKVCKYDKSIDIMIMLYICSYVGIFAGYKGIILLSGIFLMVYFLLNLLQQRNICLIKDKENTIWGIIYIYILLSSLFNIPNSLLYLLPLTLGYVVLFRKTTERNWLFSLSLVKIVSIVIACSVYCQVFIPDFFYKIAKYWFYYSNQYEFVYKAAIRSHQFSGLFYEVSFTAFVISLGMAVICVETIFRKKGRSLNIITLIALYGAIVYTGKRSFMLFVPVLVVLYAFLFNPKKTKMKVVGLFLGIIVFVFYSEKLFDWISGILTKGQKGDEIVLSGREAYWRLAVTMFRDNPLFGKGINSYDIFFNETGIKDDYFLFAGAHNSYLQILAELGVFGTLLVVGICIGYVIKGIRNAKLLGGGDESLVICNSVSLFSISIIFVYALTGNVLHQPQQLVALFFYFNIIRGVNQKIQYRKKEVE